MANEKITMCDPPSGWRWGFPKQVPAHPFKDSQDFHQWLIDNGYPAKEIRYWVAAGKSIPCRFFSTEIEK